MNARTRIDAWLQKRFALRVHMALMLAATLMVGIIATRLLFDLHIAQMWLRYMLAVVLAYGGFLALMRGWLFYIGIGLRRRGGGGSLDFSDAVSFGGGGSDFSAGGGSFGGGGASGSWGTAEPSTSSVGDGVGKLFDVDLDDGWVFILLIAVVLGILFAGIYLIWAAPAIFGETAFHAALTAALVRKTKQMHEPGWVGSVMKSTAIPFGIVLALTIALGIVAQKHCPTATRLRDALHCVRR